MTGADLVSAVALMAAWIGHACIWCYLLNASYGLPITKFILKPFRLVVGLIIVFGGPFLFLYIWQNRHKYRDHVDYLVHNELENYYLCGCLLLGGLAFPLITFLRLGNPRPACVADEQSKKIKLWPLYGKDLIGDGFWRHVARFPFNDPFTVEFTEFTIKLERLPSAWNGLTILFLSDFHFCGTPSQVYFDAILKEIEKQPTPDIVALGGDYVDSDDHHSWIAPLLGRLKWKEAGLAILGNHDLHHDPDGIRKQLSDLGFTVLSNRMQELTIRGERCLAVGNEALWNGPSPRLDHLPDGFRLGVTHTPDRFAWARGKLDLLLCGHTHGGQVRLPIIGSIFVPCVTSRAYDQGVFHKDNTVMVVGRGLGGKEPLRVNCPPQVIRITLTGEFRRAG